MMTDATASKPTCDFCGTQPSRAQLTWYPCRTYTGMAILRGGTVFVAPCVCCSDVPELGSGDRVSTFTSLSGWMACPACRVFLDAGDRDGLADRAAQRIGSGRDGETLADLRRLTARAQEGFWRHRLPCN